MFCAGVGPITPWTTPTTTWLGREHKVALVGAADAVPMQGQLSGTTVLPCELSSPLASPLARPGPGRSPEPGRQKPLPPRGSPTTAATARAYGGVTGPACGGQGTGSAHPKHRATRRPSRLPPERRVRPQPPAPAAAASTGKSGDDGPFAFSPSTPRQGCRTEPFVRRSGGPRTKRCRALLPPAPEGAQVPARRGAAPPPPGRPTPRS